MPGVSRSLRRTEVRTTRPGRRITTGNHPGFARSAFANLRQVRRLPYETQKRNRKSIRAGDCPASSGRSLLPENGRSARAYCKTSLRVVLRKRIYPWSRPRALASSRITIADARSGRDCRVAGCDHGQDRIARLRCEGYRDSCRAAAPLHQRTSAGGVKGQEAEQHRLGTAFEKDIPQLGLAGADRSRESASDV